MDNVWKKISEYLESFLKYIPTVCRFPAVCRASLLFLGYISWFGAELILS